MLPSKERCASLILHSVILRSFIRFQFQSFLFQQLGKASNFHIILGQHYFVDRINYNLDNEDKQSRRPIILFSAYRFSLEIKNCKIALINDKVNVQP